MSAPTPPPTSNSAGTNGTTAQGDPAAPRSYAAALTGPNSVSTSPAPVFLAPAPSLLPVPPSSLPPPPITRASTVEDIGDASFDGSVPPTPVTATGTASHAKGKKADLPPQPLVTAPPSAAHPPPVAGPSRAPPTYVERELQAMEIVQPIASGTRWSVPLGNSLVQNIHTVAVHSAELGGRLRHQVTDLHVEVDHLRAQVGALAELRIEGPRNGSDNDGLVASLVDGQNNGFAAISQLQEMVVQTDARVANLESSMSIQMAMLGEISHSLNVLTASRAAPTALAASAPAHVAPPTLIAAPALPAAYAPQAALVLPPAVLAPAPVLAPSAPTSAPVAPTAQAPAVPAAADAVSDAAARMGDMQALFSSAFALAMANGSNATANGKRAHDDTGGDDGRHVRPRPSNVEPLAGPSSGVPEAPAAPSAPRRPPTDPSREFVFGPVRWKSNINAEARTIIAEGMESRPNMRGFSTRRGPDNEHIIGSFDTAGATSWFIETWMSQRSGRWSSVVARPNA